MNYTDISEKNSAPRVLPEIDHMELLRLFMCRTLLYAAAEKDYYLLEKMCESAHVSNRELYEKSKEPTRPIIVSPEETIFTDMGLVLYDKAKSNPDIVDLFYEYCKEIYSQQYKQYIRFKDTYRLNPAKARDYITNFKDKEYYIFFFFFNFEDEIKDDPSLNEKVRELIEVTLQFNQRFSFAFFDLDKYVFDSGEEIFSSPQFAKFLQKERKKLVESINKTFDALFDPDKDEEHIDLIINYIMRTQTTDNSGGYSLPKDGSEICFYDTQEMIALHAGVDGWFLAMTADNDLNAHTARHYAPDVNELIRIHYMNCIKHACKHSMDNHEGFTKVKLARECEGLGGEADLYAILYLYDMDVVYKMFDMMKESYYLNFSWDNIGKKVIAARYEDRIREMQNTINVLKKKLENSSQRNRLIREEILKKDNMSDVVLNYERALAEINKKMDKKDEEILSLKEQLDIKDEYIELISQADDPIIERDVDITSLQGKRFLFVGYLDDIPELKQAFPGSMFMDSVQKSLAGIKVDAIVLLIKHMSHKMYYKIKKSSELEDQQIIYCNTSSINTIYNTLLQTKF